MSEQQGRRPKAVWGAKGIAEYINTSERRAYDLLERRLIVGSRKVGSIWQSTDLELDDFMLGRQPATSERADA
jgi:hypothetical protein